MDTNQLFNIQDDVDFEREALEIFHYQSNQNQVYAQFLDFLKVDTSRIKKLKDIPFLPIQFFKSHTVLSSKSPVVQTFLSSGTTGVIPSKHHVTDIAIYEQSFRMCFQQFYGSVEDFTILALLPSYLEREGSSLIYMVDALIKDTKNKDSGFYLDDYDLISKKLHALNNAGKKVLLIGVTYALLDLIEKEKFKLTNTIIMETGGMKGRRKEMIRTELHQKLCTGFGLEVIHSEYGMTELLSQAYSNGEGLFICPNWMKVMIRDTEDPLSYLDLGKSGGINVVDLANIESCSFIATQDLGKLHKENLFEILGRFDHSDIRGCNLLVQ
ncbi:MAG: acyl transferase [Flavobacteriaceae bacterium]|nr:MAG: acyl transferase [Flavobacteriaceae bacterium]